MVRFLLPLGNEQPSLGYKTKFRFPARDRILLLNESSRIGAIIEKRSDCYQGWSLFGILVPGVGVLVGTGVGCFG